MLQQTSPQKVTVNTKHQLCQFCLAVVMGKLSCQQGLTSDEINPDPLGLVNFHGNFARLRRTFWVTHSPMLWNLPLHSALREPVVFKVPIPTNATVPPSTVKSHKLST